MVCEQLVQHFPRLMDVGFTAEMESLLDKVADGDQQWGIRCVPLPRTSTPRWRPPPGTCRASRAACPRIGLPRLRQAPDDRNSARPGPFWHAAAIPTAASPAISSAPRTAVWRWWPRRSPNWRRWASARAAARTWSSSTPVRAAASSPARATRTALYRARGHGRHVSRAAAKAAWWRRAPSAAKIFYSCDRYPQCDFALWDKPVPGPCPRCASSLSGGEARPRRQRQDHVPHQGLRLCERRRRWTGCLKRRPRRCW